MTTLPKGNTFAGYKAGEFKGQLYLAMRATRFSVTDGDHLVRMHRLDPLCVMRAT